ncbi:maleylpyruvate isomerase family mycothiol-dependent enzyme [Micromonospora zhanjiangensis]|uniref:Maleylpyruvate isomerase family mycothiol-dependent enzyme n=1 Tax=Micromonospora zhanjiangensis TaxID=1522057 RepID=A0ABV8KNJ2_9ACTN
MDRKRYLECLAADAARLRTVAATDLAAEVPSCPGWTMTDLVRHVAQVYLHKTECMRSGVEPRDWPPDLTAEEPLALFDRAYRALVTEFDTRDDDTPSPTWYPPEQRVGFWVRRMAQETVVHRIDAELAAGAEPVSVPDDLAADGMDEVLIVMLHHLARTWPEEFRHLVPDPGQRVLIEVPGRAWLARFDEDGVTVEPVGTGGSGEPDATVSGPAPDLLRWLWGRPGAPAPRLAGDPGAVDRFRAALKLATE